MRNNLGNTEDKLEAQTIAQSEWERLSHMSLDELEANRETFKIPYSAGTGSQYTISVNLGQKGTFNNGTCGGVSGGYANCFQNTTITVYQDGNRVFTTRTLPLMAGDYTRREIDSLLASMKNDYINRDNALKNDYTSKVNNLTTRLNSKEFIKNKTPNYDLNLRYEKKSGEDSATMHAYVGDTEIEFGGGSGGGFPDLNKPISINLGSYGWGVNPGTVDTQYATITHTARYGEQYYVNTVRFKQPTWCRRAVYSTFWDSDHGSTNYGNGTFYSWAPFNKGVTYNMSLLVGSFAGVGNPYSSIGFTINEVVCYPAK